MENCRPAIEHVDLLSDDGDYVSIRGRRLKLDSLINSWFFQDPNGIIRLKTELIEARPFPFLVIDGIFNEALLRLVADEFSEDDGTLQRMRQGGDSFSRSPANPLLGPATQTYFNLIHSGKFVSTLSKITGIEDLIVDCSLTAAGFHSAKAGDRFDVHCDFNYHRKSKLRNRMVLLTYLNEDWPPEYGGDLEIWDADSMSRVTSIAPIFGRTVILVHTDRSFHGHPEPLSSPSNRTRRSLAAYFYTNDVNQRDGKLRAASVHLRKLGRHPQKATPWKRAFVSLTWRGKMRMVAEQLAPPVIVLSSRAAINTLDAVLRRLREFRAFR